MPAVCRADVEALLRSKKLDRTLVPMTATGMPDVVAQQVAKTGVSELDQQLGGGLPLGQMSEIVGPRSSGRTSVLMAILAAATARGEMVALVDTFDVFDPESAAAAGVDVHRLLWVRGESCVPAFPHASARQTGADRAIARALKAANLIVQAGMFGVMALDLADAPPQALRRVPMTTWLRFQRVLEGQDTVGVMVGNAPLSRSAGGVSLSLQPRESRLAPVSIAGGGGEGCRLPQPVATPVPAGQADGVWGAGRMLPGSESDVRVARARLVPGAITSPVRLQVSA
ncbi:MAG: hypothetical protein WCP29_12205 [Acidobacteriota bacterium]